MHGQVVLLVGQQYDGIRNNVWPRSKLRDVKRHRRATHNHKRLNRQQRDGEVATVHWYRSDVLGNKSLALGRCDKNVRSCAWCRDQCVAT